MKTNLKKILSLQKVFKSYEKNIVINNFSIDIDYGESVGVYGKNGSGKSTILKICCGLLKPDSGNIRVMGKSFNSLQESLLIKSRMGVMLHDDMLYPQLSVKENLIFYCGVKSDGKFDVRAVRMRREGSWEWGKGKACLIHCFFCYPLYG